MPRPHTGAHGAHHHTVVRKGRGPLWRSILLSLSAFSSRPVEARRSSNGFNMMASKLKTPVRGGLRSTLIAGQRLRAGLGALRA